MSCKVGGIGLIKAFRRNPSSRELSLDKEGMIFILGAFDHVKAGAVLLTIQVDTIKEDELLLSGDVETSGLAGLDDLLSGGQLVINGPVSYRFRIFLVSSMIEIQGHAEATVDLACSRCLEPFSSSVETDFELTYAEQLPEIADEFDEEIELTAEDMGISLIEGEEIDLAKPLVEQLLLSLPFQPICNENCKGLCPHCGADLNIKICGCSEPQFDTRFADLQKLKIDSDK